MSLINYVKLNRVLKELSNLSLVYYQYVLHCILITHVSIVYFLYDVTSEGR